MGLMSREYVILDLEWNQGYPKHEHSEIPFEVIEIGAVKLDRDKRITDRFESLVRPSVYKKLFFMSAKVTGISMDELKEADPFPEVFRRFMSWCGEDYIFCTWGSMDLTELRRNIRFHKLESLSHGPLPFLDIQKLYSLEYDDGKSRMALKKAVDLLMIEKTDAFHRADSDAFYTAEVFRRLTRRELERYESYDLYRLPATKAEEVHALFPTYSKYISRGFSSKGSVLHDREAASVRCFCCDRPTQIFIPWVSVNGKQYFAMGKCPEHGMMRGHLRVKKNWDGVIYGMKTIRPAKPGDEGELRQKEKAMKEQEKKLKKMFRNNYSNKSAAVPQAMSEDSDI